MPYSLVKSKRGGSIVEARKTIKRRKRTPPEELYANIEFIKIGPQKQTFGIHRGLLCDKSSYFNAALNGEFKEATEGITLQDVHAITFQMFNLWLYSGHLLSEEQKRLSVDGVATLLISACLFADYRGVPGMYNVAVDTLIRDVFCFGITTKLIRQVWNVTPEGSKLRRLYIDFNCSQVRYRKPFGS